MLTSTANPLVKRLARLHRAEERRAQGLFLVEGARAVGAFLEAGWTPEHLIAAQGAELPAAWPPAERVGAAVLERISQADSTATVVAAFAARAPAPLAPADGGLLLAGIGDPGNTGTLLRTAAALGIGQAIVLGGADPFGPKAVQASAGYLARVQVHRLEALPAGFESHACVCALVVRGGLPPAALAARPRWLAIGSEAHGLPAELLARASERLTLPMPGGTESLNAAIAGGIAAYLLFGARP